MSSVGQGKNGVAVVCTKVQAPKLKIRKADIAIAHLKEWCEVTAWHCINHVQNANCWWKRAAWLIVVLASAWVACHQSLILVLDFRDDGKWVTSISYEMPEGGAMDWPNISICNLNEYFKSRLTLGNITDPYKIAFMHSLHKDGIEFHAKYQSEHAANDSYVNETITNTLADYIKIMKKGGFTIREVLKKFTRRCRDTVLHCGLSETFALHERKFNCCDGLEKLRWRSCFSVHPSMTFGKSVKGPGTSTRNGVYYLLNPNLTDYYEYLIPGSKPVAGLSFQLYFGTFEETVPEAVLLAPGTYGRVSLFPVKHVTVPERRAMLPWEQVGEVCRPKEYFFIDSTTYSHQLCKLDCWVAWEIRECGCTTTTIALKENRDCVGENITKCHIASQDYERMNFTFPDDFNYANCKTRCAESCSYETVEVKLSQASFPAPPKLKAFTTYLNRALPETGPYSEDDAKQLILFQMFYERIEYELITKTEKSTVGQLISNVGGALGVWTGLSLLSIFQALVYLVTCVSASIASSWSNRAAKGRKVHDQALKD